MKKLLFLVLLFLPAAVFCQNIKAAVMAGINLTQVDGDGLGKYNKIGINVGASALIPLSEKFQTGFELIYTRKGSKIGAFESDFATTELRKLRLDYVEVPLMLYYLDDEKVRFGVGAAYARLINYERFIPAGKVDEKSAPPVSDSELSVVADGVYFLTEHIGINLRFSYSLFAIARWKESNQRNNSVYNNVITIRGMYMF